MGNPDKPTFSKAFEELAVSYATDSNTLQRVLTQPPDGPDYRKLTPLEADCLFKAIRYFNSEFSGYIVGSIHEPLVRDKVASILTAFATGCVTGSELNTDDIKGFI